MQCRSCHHHQDEIEAKTADGAISGPPKINSGIFVLRRFYHFHYHHFPLFWLFHFLLSWNVRSFSKILFGPPGSDYTGFEEKALFISAKLWLISCSRINKAQLRKGLTLQSDFQRVGSLCWLVRLQEWDRGWVLHWLKQQNWGNWWWWHIDLVWINHSSPPSWSFKDCVYQYLLMN